MAGPQKKIHNDDEIVHDFTVERGNIRKRNGVQWSR